jgi:xanthine/CO dehydrogenase XdhC/CoxF family maturation factor
LLLDSLRAVAEPWPEWRINRVKLDSQGGEISIIQINVSPQIRVLVCGAGPDAVPVVQSLCGLDWDVTVVDHRPGFTKPERFPAACTVVQARPEKLHEAIDLSGVDAVVIMSHHLENDSLYLGQVASHDIPYVGVLGPGVRKQRLRSMAGCEELPVRGPAGLDIGAELPTAIALSIAAEIHAVLNRRDGLSLTLKTDDKD